MRNVSLIRSAAPDAPAAIASHVARACGPHIFQPNDARLARDVAQLFSLRRRPGYFSATEKAALLRRAKQPPHDELVIDFAASRVQIALTAAGIPLATGDWTWQATANDEQITSQGSWNAVCWQSEKAVDYLEIELPLSSGWKLTRQMLLAREDRFLLLADALVGTSSEPVELRYSNSIVLADGASFCRARETREGWLESGGRRRAVVVPPALAEWRSEFCHAELLAGGGCLALQQAALGRTLYAPLWIDLDPRRLKRPVTWRRLTVAENFAAVPRDVAAAYRIEAGRDRWIIYRSLGQRGNRSVLGYNTLKSFVCRRIVAGGATQKIIEIE